MWFISFVKSSIGKKLLMAFSGFLLLCFLSVHAFGNAAIYMGSKYFQIYADTLHSFPVLVLIFGVGLIVIFAVHISIGMILFFDCFSVRTKRYEVQTRVVENTFASRTMPYTGLVILFFIAVHVYNFGISAPSNIPISVTVKESLGSFLNSLFYIISFITLAIHLNHGFWSMLQTFGFNHPKYNHIISRLTIVIPIIFLILFGGIPVFFMTEYGVNY